MGAKPTYEELEAKVVQLGRKLSPLADPKFTDDVRTLLMCVDLSDRARDYRGGHYVMITPAELWVRLFNSEPNSREITKMARSLQALYWERSALHGNLCFVKPVEEYKRDGF